MMSWVLFAAEEGGEVHHDNSWLLPGDLNEVYWGSAAFFIVFGIFLWKGLPALRGALARRTEGIETDLAAAEVASAAAADRRAETVRSFANVDAEASAIVAEGRNRAEALKTELRSRAEAEVDQAKQRAHIEIEASKSQTLADLRAEVAARTVSAAEAVVDNSLDDTTHAQLIDQYIDQVGASA
ncbi:MAG: F0F1 ATP synthase subunit B [Acidimicrobiales bacterium]